MAIVSASTNPLLSSQWYLGTIFKGDPNRIWSDYTGAGVKIGVFDDGIDKFHADLKKNYNASAELKIGGMFVDPSLGGSVHGTAVAGVIGAEANNGIGGAGIAHGSSITGFNIFTGAGAGSGFITSMRATATMDVANNSWGWGSKYADANTGTGSFGQVFADTLKNATDTGRGGLGTIIVNAAGNDWMTDRRDANASEFNADRHTITVGAIGQDGDVSSYSNRGSSVFVSGPSNGGGLAITTTDKTGSGGYTSGDYTTSFGGTSAATPIVSAVSGLMLEANKNLGWRDVQDILSITADHTTPASLAGEVAGRMEFGWTINKADNINGGGQHYSNDVGFGQIDAFEAVRFAEVWSRFGSAQTSANEQVATVSGALNKTILDNQTTEFKVNVAKAMEVESVALTLNLTHSNVNDLRIELVSPEGTKSLVLTPSVGTNSLSNTNWTFTSEALRGELAAGDWTVRITDTKAGSTGSVSSYQLDVYGDAVSANDTYHYNSEFGKMAALDATRTVLNDTDGGIDWINASATTADATINLNQGATSNIYGRGLTIAAGSVIENAVTGDGNDTLIGNDANNILLGMRGNDTFIGGLGSDTLDGGAGLDTASYVGSNTGVDVDLNRVTQIGGHAQGDTLISIENVSGSSFNDTIAGDFNANVLNGGAGNDLLNGGAGDDTLLGGLGDDILIGGAGADSLDGGGGIDTASYASATSGISFVVGDASRGRGDAAGDSFNNISRFIGSAFDDQMTGSSANEYLDGGFGNDLIKTGGGNDTLIGGEGNDTLVGGIGADSIDGGNGIDTVDYSESVGNVFVDLLNGNGYGGDAQGDKYINVENIIGSNRDDRLDGTNGNNTISAGLGNDVVLAWGGNDFVMTGLGNDFIDGGLGDDTIIGGLGNDTMYGGKGADLFVFNERNFGNDLIYDFQDNIDKIDMRGLGLKATDLSFTTTYNSTIMSCSAGNITFKGAERGLINAYDFLL